MEMSKKPITLPPSSANKPPISPKPFTLIPSSTTTLPMATGSFEGWQKPYFMSHDGAGSSRGTTKPYQKSFCGLNCPPSIEVVPNEKHEVRPLLSKNNPITAVAPSSTNSRGITVSTQRGIDYELTWGRNLNLNMDEKKLKRILSNRISAKKARLRKSQYVSDLEKKLKDLQAELAILNPTVEKERENNKMQRRENILLKEELRCQEEKEKLSLAQLEENRAEVKRFIDLYAAARKRMGLDLNQVAEEIELEPALNFKSLTVDPPKSLMSSP